MTCLVCRGRKTITLPLYHELSAVGPRFDFSTPEATTPSSKVFDCPECVEKVPYRKVRTVKLESKHALSKYAQLQGAIHHDLTMVCADFLMREGCITFTNSPVPRGTNPEPFVTVEATLGVVDSKDMGTLEQRVAARQLEVVDEVVAAAQWEVNNWGSYYGQTHVSKTDASRLIRDGGKAIVERRTRQRQ